MADSNDIQVIPHAASGTAHAREERDVLDGILLLKLQHEDIRGLLDEVAASRGGQRQAAFDQLREMLARHETAEEMVLRPVSRQQVGAAVADARMDEENAAKKALAHLESLDVHGEEFAAAFASFAADVRAHADAEEREEFDVLDDTLEPRLNSRLAEALRMAERTAPTHPHPSADSTTKNYVLGPFAALADRARDAIGKLHS